MRSLFPLLLFILAAPAISAQSSPTGPPAPSASDWIRDLDDIARDLRAYHPNPFSKTGELSFRRALQRLKDALPSLSEEQRVVGTMRLVALIGDGHTQLEPGSARFAYWYPVRLYEFTDGYFVTSAHPSVRELAGAEVLEVAGRPVREVAEEARRLMGADNAFGRKEHLYPLHNAGLMKGLGYAAVNGELKIKARLRDGEIADRILAPPLARCGRTASNASAHSIGGCPRASWTSEMPAGISRNRSELMMLLKPAS